jgi:pimeloyl-ACP methyl ester carboxylesterase
MQATRPETIEIATTAGAVALARRFASPSPVRLLVSHGNGFAIDGYRDFWEPLIADFEVLVFDQRNHGHNPPSPPGNHRCEILARDLEYVVKGLEERLPAKRCVGVFHSLSARCAMLQGLKSPRLLDALVLFDPPTVAPFESALRKAAIRYHEHLIHWAMTRQSRFNDPAELAEFIRAQPVNRNWTTSSVDAMARSILRPTADGSAWELCCPGELEAQLYRENTELNLWPNASDYDARILLVGSDPGKGVPNFTGDTNRALAKDGGFEFVTVPGTGHLMQVEKPDACASLVRDFVAGLGLHG